MAAFVLGACFLTYYFRTVVGTGALFTHFFYIPIILSCIWWKRKGLIVPLILIGVLMFSDRLFKGYALTMDDYLRSAMLFLISLIVAWLSEALAGMEEKLAASGKKYRAIFETTGTATVIIEKDTTISLINAEFERMSGYSKEEVENKMSWTEFFAEEDLERMKKYHALRRFNANSAPTNYECLFLTREKEIKNAFATVDMIPGTQQSVASFLDITPLKQSMEQQQKLQESLSGALAKVLGGFIPICASCKKIRNEQAQWIQVEEYIMGKTDASFSHGICPECAVRLYPEFLKRESVG